MNILLMTNSMKQPDDTYSGKTDVVFYFAKEWAKAGHKVVVIHSETKFPLVYYLVPKGIISKMQRKKFFIVPSVASRKRLKREESGIHIYRIPMLKIIPHSGFTEIQYKSQLKLVSDYLAELDFIPDVITGHWLEPQLRLIHDLGKKYHAKTGFVVHGRLPNNLKPEYKEYIKELNCFFLRSEYMKKLTIESEQREFMPSRVSVCYSGIPDHYLNSIVERNDWKRDGVFRIVYVGRLVATKRINAIIEAAATYLADRPFSIDIIGDGDEMDNLKAVANSCGILNRITFHGRLDRDNVQEKLKEADCFAMIGENEVFGLVYLEAMAAGCITIASVGSGVDGIIQNRQNGYLSPAGNADALGKIFQEIVELNKTDVMEIREKARRTVIEFTDSNVARMCLDDIVGKAK